jgi:hypothetical protein
VGKEGGDLPLFRGWASDMRSRDDGKVGRAGTAWDRDSDDVIGRQPKSRYINDPSGSSDAAVTVKHRRRQGLIDHELAAVGI